jgi:hypothetical protein
MCEKLQDIPATRIRKTTRETEITEAVLKTIKQLWRKNDQSVFDPTSETES